MFGNYLYYFFLFCWQFKRVDGNANFRAKSVKLHVLEEMITNENFLNKVSLYMRSA